LGKFGMDVPVPCLVGVGQRRAFDLASKPHVVKLGRLRRQTGFDVAQTLAVGQLGESHGPELLGASERLHVAIATMSIDDASEGGPGQEIHQLSKQGLAGVHGRLRERYPRKSAGTPFCCSNRHHPYLPRIWLQS
jgi:hypothetical protein